MAVQAQKPFQFPREYHFPPFYTMQPNLTTRHAQLTKWSSLILAYCRHHRIFKISISNASAGTSTHSTEDLFHNKRLDRRLAPADIREVLEFMRTDGLAEFVVRDGAGDVCWVFWRTPEEWAAIVEAWIDETAQRGTVLTMYELTEGEGTRGTGRCRRRL
jgi:ESCRT-II complex subunit VPS25